MPELPEVEYARQVADAAARGRTIARVHVLHAAQRRHLGEADARRLVGATVGGVTRRAKYQLIATDRGVLLVHFRMNGDWHVGRAEDDLPRHARVAFEFTDGTRLTLADSRALASVSLHASEGDAPLPALGPEATDPTLTARALKESLRARRGPIKPALLDQRVIAGLGNIYAAEALWNARISPSAIASSLTTARLARLLDGARRALADAEHDPGRYARGEATARLHVYGREGEPCDRCGQPIRRVVQAGRSTFYCARCQRA